MEIGIETDDPNAGPLDIRVGERGDDEVDGERRRIAVRLEADPEDPGSEELVALARSPEVKDLLRSGDEYEDIAACADAIEAYFDDRGFPDVTATVIGEGSLEVTIR